MKSDVNCGRRVIRMYQCRFINFNKCATLGEDAEWGSTWVRGGPGVYGNSALSAQFCCKPKAALKSKFY